MPNINETQINQIIIQSHSRRPRISQRGNLRLHLRFLWPHPQQRSWAYLKSKVPDKEQKTYLSGNQLKSTLVGVRKWGTAPKSDIALTGNRTIIIKVRKAVKIWCGAHPGTLIHSQGNLSNWKTIQTHSKGTPKVLVIAEQIETQRNHILQPIPTTTHHRVWPELRTDSHPQTTRANPSTTEHTNHGFIVLSQDS